MITFKEILNEQVELSKDIVPTIWYHTTSPENKESILKNGFNEDVKGFGTYGAGIYFSNPIENRGDATITIDSSNLNIFKINNKKTGWDNVMKKRKMAIQSGYDGICFIETIDEILKPLTWYLLIFQSGVPKLKHSFID